LSTSMFADFLKIETYQRDSSETSPIKCTN
jgi:hypothetical protein